MCNAQSAVRRPANRLLAGYRKAITALQIQRYAGARGCAQILLDADGSTVDGPHRWEWRPDARAGSSA